MVLASVGDDLIRAVLQGLPPGSVYALIALGFVLAYKTSGVFNLAFGAQAYVSAVAFFKANTQWGWPIVPSFIFAVLLIAPLLGLLLERLIFRNLRTAPPIAGLVVAIGLTVALPSIVDILLDFRPKGGQTPKGIVPKGGSVYYDVLGKYAFSRNELAAMVIGLVAVIGLAAIFRFSVIGLRMRAVVESPRMTELNGVAADRVSAAAWALSSLFAGLAGVLIAPRSPSLNDADFFNLMVIAIAAAAIGSLVNLPRAFAGGLGLGVLTTLFTTFVPKWSKTFTWLEPIKDNVTPAIPFLVLFSVIVFVPSIRRSQRATDPLSGVDPPPAATAIVANDPRGDLIRRIVIVAIVAAIGAVVFTRGDGIWLFLVTQAVVLGIVYMSITMLTGMGGFISLCQASFAATGAFVVFQLVDRYDVPVLVGTLIGAVVAAIVGGLLSLLILRLNGIWIAIATLAFAFFFDSVMIKFSWFGGSKDGKAALKVARPLLGPWDLKSDKAFLVLAVIVLVLVAAGVTAFGRSTFGRTLTALRSSEVAAQSIGISPARARVVVFAFSAGVAALGGGLLAIQQKAVNYDSNFKPFVGLFWLVLVVTFGARSAKGAIVAAGAYSVMNKLILDGTFLGWILRSADRIPGIFPLSSKWQLVLFGLGTIQFARHPEGVIEMTRVRAAEKRAKKAARRAPAPSLQGAA